MVVQYRLAAKGMAGSADRANPAAVLANCTCTYSSGRLRLRCPEKYSLAENIGRPPLTVVLSELPYSLNIKL